MDTISDLVRAGCDSSPEGPALLAPGRPALSYAGLAGQLAETARALTTSGVGRGDRVGLLVENGPAAAAAFLGIASVAAAVPLNPAYREEEIAFALEDARVTALVVGATLGPAGREVAGRLGLPVLELTDRPDAGAGVFTLAVPTAIPVSDEPPRTDDVALLLHTSGTTARPKLVPLRQRELVVSARNVARVLQLEPVDRCLNVMPLFHIHGIVAALLASLSAGGSVACAPGFHQLRFFEWLAELHPTWYTAVPTMHQAVLERAQANPEVVAGHRLRFVRSSSAALPVGVLEALEQIFDVPVIEAYGMTEAAHQMASNPLPPAERRPGSVGMAAGPEIAVLDAAGAHLPPGEVGEVAIRGENVFGGYERNPEANATAFSEGWFRTGDLGTLSPDGFLKLVGRSKELVNRGGEKISPPEVEDVLTRHPSVGQAVVFAIPDPRLGEEVAAAVVAAPDGAPDERELQDFVAQTLAPFKVPRRVLVVDEIPTGATGKLQRIGLADRLGIEPVDPLPSQRPSLGVLEKRLVALWEEVLALEGLDAGADFFALGGDSILAAEAIARIRDLTGEHDIPLVAIARAPTPATMGSEVYAHAGRGHSGLIHLHPGTESPPLALVHPGDGEVLLYAPLARRLGDRPVIAFRAHGIDDGSERPASIEEMAESYLTELRAAHPSGPYVLGGFCLGGAIATEMAWQLEEAGEAVHALLLLDPRFRRPTGAIDSVRLAATRLVKPAVFSHTWTRLTVAAHERRLVAVARRRAAYLRRGRPISPERRLAPPSEQSLAVLREAYRPRRVSAPTQLVVGRDYHALYGLPDWYIRQIAPNIVSTVDLPWRHEELFLPPAIETLADAVRRALG